MGVDLMIAAFEDDIGVLLVVKDGEVACTC
jgi:hypothetical protein